MEEFGLIDIDAPLPDQQQPQTVIQLTHTRSQHLTPQETTTSPESTIVQTDVTTHIRVAAPATTHTVSASIAEPAELDASVSAFASSSTASSSSTSAVSSSTSSSVFVSSGISFDPPVLQAPSSRFLDVFTPIKPFSISSSSSSSSVSKPGPTALSAAPEFISLNNDLSQELRPLDSTNELKERLSAYKRKRQEISEAKKTLNSLTNRSRGGEEFIDLKAFAGNTNKPATTSNKTRDTVPTALPTISMVPTSLSHLPSYANHVYEQSALTAPWMTHLYHHNNFSHRLHEELLDFAAFISPTPKEDHQRMTLIQRLTSLLHSIYPRATLQTFGSCATKLYLPMSDIDVVIFNTPEYDDIAEDTALEVIAKHIRKQQWASYLEVISNARIPIVKFTDKATGLKIDISREMTGGVKASQWLNSIIQKFPAFRPLTLFLKYFLYVRGLNDTYTGGMGSFLLQLLIISHLHFHPAQTHDVNLGLLLLSFLDCYAHQLHYQSIGLSISPQPSYYLKSSRDRYNEQRPYLLSVQNPFDAEHDVASNSYAVMKVRKAFQYAYAQLTKKSVMEGRAEGSLLALIVSCEEESLIERGRMWRERINQRKKENEQAEGQGQGEQGETEKRQGEADHAEQRQGEPHPQTEDRVEIVSESREELEQRVNRQDLPLSSSSSAAPSSSAASVEGEFETSAVPQVAALSSTAWAVTTPRTFAGRLKKLKRVKKELTSQLLVLEEEKIKGKQASPDLIKQIQQLEKGRERVREMIKESKKQKKEEEERKQAKEGQEQNNHQEAGGQKPASSLLEPKPQSTKPAKKKRPKRSKEKPSSARKTEAVNQNGADRVSAYYPGDSETEDESELMAEVEPGLQVASVSALDAAGSVSTSKSTSKKKKKKRKVAGAVSSSFGQTSSASNGSTISRKDRARAKKRKQVLEAAKQPLQEQQQPPQQQQSQKKQKVD